MLKYKGYSATVELDEGAGVLQGEVIGTRDVITFQADSVETIIAEFHASVDGYLDFCSDRGEAPEKSLSGQFLVRSTPELHRRIHIAASASGMSVNAWLTKALEEDTQDLLEDRAAGAAGAAGAASRRPRDGDASPAAAAGLSTPSETGTGGKPGGAPDSGPDTAPDSAPDAAPGAARVLRRIADALKVYLDNLV